MPYRDDYEDASRHRSWSDVDRNRKKSPHVRDDRDDRRDRRDRDRAGSGRDMHPDSREYKQYLKDLEQMFDTGEVSDKVKQATGGRVTQSQGAKARARILKKVREAEGPAAFNEALSEYLANYPMPDDEDILTRAVDHSDAEIVQSVIAHIQQLHSESRFPKRRALIERLRTIEAAARVGKTRRMAEALRMQLEMSR